LSDSTKRVNRTAIIAERAARARRRDEGTEEEIEKEIKEEIEKEIEEEPEMEPEKNLGGPLPNQRSLTPSNILSASGTNKPPHAV
jgi:hypothetical protein